MRIKHQEAEEIYKKEQDELRIKHQEAEEIHKKDREELRIKRETELSQRILWCIANGHTPANENMWRAPATTEQDALMGPKGLPWHADGSLRAEGVP